MVVQKLTRTLALKSFFIRIYLKINLVVSKKLRTFTLIFVHKISSFTKLVCSRSVYVKNK